MPYALPMLCNILCALLLTSVIRVQGLCDFSILQDVWTTRNGTDNKPSDILNDYIRGRLLNDRCISTHVKDFWKFTKSYLKADKQNEFNQVFYNGQEIVWQADGSLEADDFNNRIKMYVRARVPNGVTATARLRYMYILDVQHGDIWSDGKGGAVITYYTCWADPTYTNWNVFITQLEGGTHLNRAIFLQTAVDGLKVKKSAPSLSPIICY